MKRILTKDVQRGFFVTFLYLPEIILIATNLFFFIYGIVDSNMVHIDTSLFDIRYGVFRFKSMFATFILWVVIGFFGSLINWAYLRIIISPIAILVMNVDTDFSKEEEIDPRKFRFARSKSTPTHIKSPVVKKNFLRTPA